MVLVVLQLRDLTEVAQLYFQEVAVEAKIQVVEVDSEGKISVETDFLLREKESSSVSINHYSKHTPAPPTPHTLLLSNGLPNYKSQSRPRLGVTLQGD